jgi:hypothetical protein
MEHNALILLQPLVLFAFGEDDVEEHAILTA